MAEATIKQHYEPALIIRATYDFAIQGGVVGDIKLGVKVPKDFIIVQGILHVLTVVTGGAGATAAIKVEAAGDIVAAAVVTGAPWSTTGKKDVVPVGTAATAVLTTVERELIVSVGVLALTAGKFQVVLLLHDLRQDL